MSNDKDGKQLIQIQDYEDSIVLPTNKIVYKSISNKKKKSNKNVNKEINTELNRSKQLLVKDFYIDKTKERLKIEEGTIFPVNTKKNVTVSSVNNNINLINSIKNTSEHLGTGENKSKTINKFSDYNDADFFFQMFRSVAGENDKLKGLTDKICKVNHGNSASENNFDINTNVPNKTETNKVEESISAKIKSITNTISNTANSNEKEESLNLNDSFTKYDMTNREQYLGSVIKNIHEFSSKKNKSKEKRSDLFDIINNQIEDICKTKKKSGEIDNIQKINLMDKIDKIDNTDNTDK